LATDKNKGTDDMPTVFEVTATGRFDDLSAARTQCVGGLGNGSAQDSTLFGRPGNTPLIWLEV